MLYFANPCRAALQAMSEGRLGCITTPKQGNIVPPGATWCADNGRFGKGWPGEVAWFTWLISMRIRYGADRCAFAVAPDVVGDAVGTLLAAYPWLHRVRALGLPVAYVAQDGCDGHPDLIPWGSFDVLFLGGSTEFKLSDTARDLTYEAHTWGVPVHMGRVNSRKRVQTAASWGCASVDGTYLTFGPQINLPKVLSWMEEVNRV